VIRSLLGTVGVLATAGGLLLLLTPATAPAAVPVLAGLGITGVLGLVAGAVGLLARSATDVRTAGFAESDGCGLSVPGDAFDQRLAELSITAEDAEREVIRDRLLAAAAVTLAEAEQCSREVARARVSAGEWPADDRVHAFFTDAPPSLRERVRTVVTGDPTFVRRARHAATVVTDQRRSS
jgi:hypothetical protein